MAFVAILRRSTVADDLTFAVTSNLVTKAARHLRMRPAKWEGGCLMIKAAGHPAGLRVAPDAIGTYEVAIELPRVNVFVAPRASLRRAAKGDLPHGC
jgi:hypothetical protein